MKLKYNIPFGVLFIILLSCFSCKKEPGANADLRSILAENKFALQGDSLQQFTNILDKLDTKNEPFKHFVYHTFYEIQDSLDVVMPYNDALTGTAKEKYDLKKYDLTLGAINSYQKRLAITEKDEVIMRYAFVLDPNVKRFCIKYIEEVTNGEIPAEE